MSDAPHAPPTAPHDAPRRRHLLYAGAAGVAALAGGLVWHTAAPPAGDGGSGGDRAPDSLWALRVARPDGRELALADWRGQPLLLNFWATWCPPCVRELPAFDQFHLQQQARAARSERAVGVIALAIDGPGPVREFIGRHPVRLPVGLAGLDGSELMRALGNAQGALPYSVLLDGDGRVVERRLGETSAADLQAWARTVGAA
ncbi:MAG: hypothetical protein RLY78_4381 [Pseudomonadota bacterium]|jgi:thiol-disulfide isomerase/thioredoxin